MDANHLSAPVLEKVDKFYELAYPQRKLFNEERIITCLPTALRTEIYRDMYQQVLAGVRFLPNRQNKMVLNSSIARAVRTAVCDAIRRETFMSGDVVAAEGAQSHTMFVILNGEMKISEKGVCVHSAFDGAVLGQYSLFVKKRRLAYTCIANVFTRAITLQAKSMIAILRQYPSYCHACINWLIDERDRLTRGAVSETLGKDPEYARPLMLARYTEACIDTAIVDLKVHLKLAEGGVALTEVNSFAERVLERQGRLEESQEQLRESTEQLIGLLTEQICALTEAVTKLHKT